MKKIISISALVVILSTGIGVPLTHAQATSLLVDVDMSACNVDLTQATDNQKILCLMSLYSELIVLMQKLDALNQQQSTSTIATVVNPIEATTTPSSTIDSSTQVVVPTQPPINQQTEVVVNTPTSTTPTAPTVVINQDPAVSVENITLGDSSVFVAQFIVIPNSSTSCALNLQAHITTPQGITIRNLRFFVDEQPVGVVQGIVRDGETYTVGSVSCVKPIIVSIRVDSYYSTGITGNIGSIVALTADTFLPTNQDLRSMSNKAIGQDVIVSTSTNSR